MLYIRKGIEKEWNRSGIWKEEKKKIVYRENLDDLERGRIKFLVSGVGCMYGGGNFKKRVLSMSL